MANIHEISSLDANQQIAMSFTVDQGDFITLEARDTGLGGTFELHLARGSVPRRGSGEFTITVRAQETQKLNLGRAVLGNGIF